MTDSIRTAIASYLGVPPSHLDWIEVTTHRIDAATKSLEGAQFRIEFEAEAESTEKFPVTAAWLAATAEDFEQRHGVHIKQYGLYFDPRYFEPPIGSAEPFIAVDPADGGVVEVERLMRLVRANVIHESAVELVCIHLDNGDEFYIRPIEAYSTTLDSDWRSWVELSRGIHAPGATG